MKLYISGILIYFIMSLPVLGEIIKGKITVPVRKKAPRSRSYSRGVYEPKLKHETPVSTVKDSLKIVVWAEPIGENAPFKPLDNKPVMNQNNKQFIPDLLIIQAGTTVGFPNLDPIYHNVFSYSKVKRFDLGRYPTGKSKDVTFSEKGVVDLFCEIHEHMHAYIVVVDTPYFVRTNNNGDFSLDVPTGKYTVFVWIPGQQSEAAKVDLSSESESIVNFSF